MIGLVALVCSVVYEGWSSRLTHLTQPSCCNKLCGASCTLIRCDLGLAARHAIAPICCAHQQLGECCCAYELHCSGFSCSSKSPTCDICDTARRSRALGVLISGGESGYCCG
mmetsp:Transcript_4305/g.13044  ORF Transcript_4305/g.13044 Transcript_4305/m.13044 type:complete len:112 (-) Transcript_4305:434-769(-)